MPFIISQVPDTSFNKASGIKAGDIITKLNTTDTKYRDQLIPALETFKGSEVTATVLRDKKEVTLPLKVSDDGKLVVVGDTSNTTIQNFIRLDQSGEAKQLLTERIETRLNPYSRTAEVRGEHQSLAEIKQILPEHAQVWGPVAIE